MQALARGCAVGIEQRAELLGEPGVGAGDAIHRTGLNCGWQVGNLVKNPLDSGPIVIGRARGRCGAEEGHACISLAVER
jgi:hypothetical protein